MIQAPPKLNRFEALKAGRDPLSLEGDLERFARDGVESIPTDDVERLRVFGIALRPRTPGYFMLRVRVPAGQATAAQVRVLGEVANEFGRGKADITSRAQLQLRWITIADVPEIFRRLRACGLASLQTLLDSIRNIRGCPLAGVSTHEAFDATPVVHAIERLVLGQSDVVNLPRKMNIAITGCTHHCCDADVQDLSLVPARRLVGGVPTLGFNVLVGGKMSAGDPHVAQPLGVFVTREAAPALVHAIIGVFHDHGPRQTRTRTRLVYLLQQWGLDRFRTELARRLGTPLLPAGEDLRSREVCDSVGVQPESTGDTAAVGLLVPVGRLTGDHLIELARLAELYGNGSVRFTAEQNVLLPGIGRDRVAALLAEPLVRNQLRADPDPVIRGTVSCTGIDYCSMAVIETKRRALELSRELARRVPGAKPLRIHWSGCRAGCGQHAIADIGLLGRKAQRGDRVVEAVDVFVGGSPGPDATAGLKLLEAVPCDELADVLEGLVRYGMFDKVRQQLHANGVASAATTAGSGMDRVDPIMLSSLTIGGTTEVVL